MLNSVLDVECEVRKALCLADDQFELDGSLDGAMSGQKL